jgi:membrane protein required for colicin V production
MTEVDYAILGVLVLSSVFGMLRGFLREALGLATWVIGLWLAWRHSDVMEPYLGGLLATEPLRIWAARGLMLIAVLALGTLISVLVSQFVRVTLFSGFDRLLGFAFGVVRALVIVGLLTMVGQRLQLDGEAWWKASRLVPYAEVAAGFVRGLVGEAAAEIQRATNER